MGVLSQLGVARSCPAWLVSLWRFFYRIEWVVVLVILRSVERRWSGYLILSDSWFAELFRIPSLVAIWAFVSGLALIVVIANLLSAPIVAIVARWQRRTAGLHVRRFVWSVVALFLPVLLAQLAFSLKGLNEFQHQQLSHIADQYKAVPDAIAAFHQKHSRYPNDLNELVPEQLPHLPRAPLYRVRFAFAQLLTSLGIRVESASNTGWSYQRRALEVDPSALDLNSSDDVGAAPPLSEWILGVDASLEGYPASLHTPPQVMAVDPRCVTAAKWQLCRPQ